MNQKMPPLKVLLYTIAVIAVLVVIGYLFG
jgi:hypothetical protein